MKKNDWVLVFVCFLILLSRLPFLSLGYGVDSDAWRLAISARFISDSGEYTPSRLPGFPVHEYASSLLWRGGPLALNLATLCISLVGLFVFGFILRRLDVREPWLGVLALGFTPVIFISSVSALDYLWALTFILIAFYFALHSKWWLAGILVGLAVGCRITSILMLLPLTILALNATDSPGRLKPIVLLWGMGIVTGLICFSPVLSNQGWEFVQVSMGDYPDWSGVFRRGTTGVWGRLGLVGLGVGTVFGLIDWFRGKHHSRTAMTKAVMLASIVTIFVYILLYFLMPHESGYLVPMIPFVIILFGVMLSKETYRIVCVFLLLSPFFYVDVKYSPIEFHYRTRTQHMDYAQSVLELVEDFPTKSVIIAGGNWRPILQTLVHDRSENSAVFVSTASEKDLTNYQNQGYSIYYFQEMEQPLMDILGTRFEEFGMQRINSRSMNAN